MWMVFFWVEIGGRAFVVDGLDATSHAHGLQLAAGWMPIVAAQWAEVYVVPRELL